MTFIFFWVLIGLAYLADVKGQCGGNHDEGEDYVEFETVEIYRTLIEEKKNPN